MKSSKLILALWLGASAWALTSPQKQQANPPAVAPSSAPSPIASAPASAARTSSSAAQSSPGTPGRRRRATRPNPARKVSAANGDKSASTHPAQRDPFVSPVVERVRQTAACTGTGRQCLLVGEISLRGVVTSPSGPIAVVVNGDHTYFLREHDPLANGAVERIGKDAIILRERSSDSVGRPLMREVVKKLGQSAD